MKHKYIKNIYNSVVAKIRLFGWKKIAIICGGCLSLTIITGLSLFLSIPSEIKLSLRPDTCVTSSLYSLGSSKQSSGGLTYSTGGGKLCISPNKPLVAGEYHTFVPVFGLDFLRRPIKINVPELPKAQMAVEERVPLSQPIEVILSGEDDLHGYDLRRSDNTAPCKTIESGRLACDLAPLKMSQGQSYEVSLERSFRGDKYVTLAKQEINILDPISLSESSVGRGSTIYSKPDEILLKYNKPLVAHDIVMSANLPDKSTIDVPTQVNKIDESSYKIIFDPEKLPRESTISINQKDVTAQDGSTLENPEILSFKTSGGPQMQSNNIKPTGMAISGSIAMVFDQPLSNAQDINKYITVRGVEAQVNRLNNQVTVSYSADRCVDFTINIAAGIESDYGVVSSGSQAISSRTTCQTIETIGYSVQGRPINAHFFGSGSHTILFTGAIHGNERSSAHIMNSLIVDLEANARNIPAGRQIVIVPIVSPDGHAKGDRFNGRGVNLNRNWQTVGWESAEGAGGVEPMSEPEVQALARLTQRLNPAFVATYHAQGRIVNSNDVGSAISLGQRYAASVRYRFVPEADTVAVFGGTITGTYEDWLKERGTPAILMELDNHSGNFFTTHKAAIWAMIGAY